MAVLKSADDKSKRLALLEDLQKSPRLDARQKKWLREELGRTRKGLQGERESAFYLDQYFREGENHVLLHDLRFVIDGDVAQIDHLVLSRVGLVYLIETKNYSGNVSISDFGEFTVEYDGDIFGVASPIEQSLRHERILRRLFERLEITPRVGGGFDFNHVVMFHPKAIIQRPTKSGFDTTNIIKADQFPSWHERFVNKEVGAARILFAAANMRSLDTIKEWAEKLRRQHRPANPLQPPDFMTPQKVLRPALAASAAIAERVIEGIEAATAPEGEKRLVCLHCRSKISFAEGKYCWNNAARFNGGQYCREHQKLF